MIAAKPSVREPKQERSRQSFDKALDAAVSLMVERGSDSFTLAEVAKRAGVSIGSIYARVDSRDDLLRTAHAREMERMQAAHRQAFAFPEQDVVGETLPDTVARLVRTLGEVLRANAAVLIPFMALAGRDPIINGLGQTVHADLGGHFRTALLARRAEIQHPSPERAVTWSFTVAYSVLARWLGLGSQPEAAHEGQWDDILADLAEMITAFLSRKQN